MRHCPTQTVFVVYSDTTYSLPDSIYGDVTTRRLNPRSETDTYAYDRNGNMTSWTDRRGEVITCAYDSLNALIERVADGDTTAFKTDPDDRFVVAANAFSHDSIAYDVEGRQVAQVTKRGATTFTLTSTWNARNQRTSLTQTSPSSRSVSFVYDQHGQLDTLTDVSGGKTAVSYNADRQATEYELLTPNKTKSLQFPSTHRPGEVTWDTGVLNDAFGVLLAQDDMNRISQRFFAGSDTSKDRYDPWGQPESWMGETTFNRFRFAGACFDTPTVWLIYLTNRYYDPVLRRFISEDPIGLAGGINPYVYAGNDPVNRTDRFGLSADCLISGVATYEWDAFKEEWDLLSVKTTGTICLHAGRGGGGGGGAPAPPSPTPPAESSTGLSPGRGECLTASLLAFATSGADLSTFTGAGLVGRLLISSFRGYAGPFAARQALYRLTPEVVKGAGVAGADLVGTAYAQYGATSLTGQAYLRLTAGRTANVAGASARDDAMLAMSASGNGFEFGFQDLIPGWASARSISQAVAACSGS